MAFLVYRDTGGLLFRLVLGWGRSRSCKPTAVSLSQKWRAISGAIAGTESAQLNRRSLRTGSIVGFDSHSVLQKDPRGRRRLYQSSPDW
jgi:hypothetical protein